MRIELKKFGTTLTSRQAGKEASLVISNNVRNLNEEEKIEIDFDGVQTFSPSWGDEFLSPLVNDYISRIILLNTENLSVQSSIELLEEIHKVKFTVE
jgi:hypothetical protein